MLSQIILALMVSHAMYIEAGREANICPVSAAEKVLGA